MCLQRAMAEEVPWGTFKGLEGRRCAFIAVLGGKEEMIREEKVPSSSSVPDEIREEKSAE